MNAVMLALGGALVASPFVALAAVWVRDFGVKDFLRHLAAFCALAAVISAGVALLMVGVGA